MSLPSKSAAAFFLAAILLCNLSQAEFSMRSLSVFININRDGGVNAEERLVMLINGTSSRSLYEATRSAYSDLATWKERTGLSEMRHHVSRATADIVSLRILPQAIERCNSFMGTCFATVVIDYSVPASQNGSGLVRVERYKPRTARYSINQNALSFEQTKSGDLVLPKGTNISIAIPQAAEKIYFSTLPTNLLDEPESSFRYDQDTNLRFYVGSKRIFTWQGDTLPKFEFTYEIEAPLESEVLDFFREMQARMVQLFAGPEGPAAAFIVAAAAISLYYLHKIGK
ncbi:MAG: hypothetical protein N3E51_00140 [Candidatus Micrarchaeota archaeon]|nr:hypothetical protein [Candidatus Micrarchaeota archaeon]